MTIVIFIAPPRLAGPRGGPGRLLVSRPPLLIIALARRCEVPQERFAPVLWAVQLERLLIASANAGPLLCRASSVLARPCRHASPVGQPGDLMHCRRMLPLTTTSPPQRTPRPHHPDSLFTRLVPKLTFTDYPSASLCSGCAARERQVRHASATGTTLALLGALHHSSICLR